MFTRRTARLSQTIAILGALVWMLAACGGDTGAQDEAGAESEEVDEDVSVDVREEETQAESCDSVDDVTFGSSPIGPYAPPQVAVREGLMAKYCINLISKPIESASVSMAEVVAGRQDLVLINPTGLVSAVANGQKLKAIAPNTAENADNPLYIAADGPIEEPTDLEGEQVHTTALGSTTDIANREALAQRGVDTSTIEFVFVSSGPSTAEALISGQTAAGQVNPPHDVYNAEEIEVLIESPTADVFGEGAPGSFIVGREEWVNDNPDLVERFQKAYLEGAMLVQEDETVLRDTLKDMLELEPEVIDEMPITAMNTDYKIDSVITQVEKAVEYEGIPKGLPEDEIRDLFVPLPDVDELD